MSSFQKFQKSGNSVVKPIKYNEGFKTGQKKQQRAVTIFSCHHTISGLLLHVRATQRTNGRRITTVHKLKVVKTRKLKMLRRQENGKLK